MGSDSVVRPQTALRGPLRNVVERVPAFSSAWIDRLVVVAVAVCAHGLLVLNNGVYWDDWLLYTQLQNGDWSSVQGLADQLGGIPSYLYIWVAGAALPPPVIGFKIVAFVLIATSALLIYEICIRAGLVARFEAVLIACLAVSFPGDHTHVLLITLPYVVYWVAFLAAILILLVSEDRRRYWVVYRIAALITLFFSFGLNSLLTFYFGVLLIGAMALIRRKGISPIRFLTSELPKRLDLVVLPFLFWVIYRKYFPPNGIYGYYHQFDLDPVSLQGAINGFWQWGLLAQFRDALGALASVALIWIVLLIGVQRFWPRQSADRPNFARPIAMLALGLLLLVLAATPYVVVGLSPSDAGWSSRHTILFGVPVALIVVGAAGLLFRSENSRIGVVGGVVIASLVLGFTVDAAYGYVSWEARWLTDSSLVMNLAATPGADRYSVYWVDDRYRLGGDPQYRFYEWSALLDRAFGGESRLGVESSAPPDFLDTNRKYFTKSYNLVGFDPLGCQAHVTISRGPTAGSEIGMMVHYYVYSLVNPTYRDRWVAGLVAVDVETRPSPAASHCASG